MREKSTLRSMLSSSESKVIPIRPPSGKTILSQVKAPPRPRTLSTPVEQRPWRVLLVPPTSGAPPLTFNLPRWQARLALSAVAALLLVVLGAATVLILSLDGPDPVAANTEVASLRSRLRAVEDSLEQTRLALENGAAADAAKVGLVPAAPVRSKLAAVAAKPKKFFERLQAMVEPDAGDEVSDMSAPTSARFGLPVAGTITSAFSPNRRHPILHISRPHLGLDIAAVRGTQIISPAAGRVRTVVRKFATGLMIEIEHPNGIVTRYMHLKSASVREGQEIAKGVVIGAVGSSGLTTGPHLHYEIWKNGAAMDPLGFHMPQAADSTRAGVGASAPGTDLLIAPPTIH